MCELFINITEYFIIYHMKKKIILGVIENCTKNVIVQGFENFFIWNHYTTVHFIGGITNNLNLGLVYV